MTTKQLTTIEKKINPLVIEATNLTIESKEDLELATTLLSNLNKINDEIDKEKQKVLKPLNEARTAEINRWKPSIMLYESAITLLRQKLSTYQTNAVQRTTEATTAIADRVGEGKGSLKLETAMKKIDALEKPVESVSTSAGTLKFRATPTLKITNPDIIPRKFLIPDEAMIMESLKAGNKVEGCEISIIQVPVNHR